MLTPRRSRPKSAAMTGISHEIILMKVFAIPSLLHLGSLGNARTVVPRMASSRLMVHHDIREGGQGSVKLAYLDHGTPSMKVVALKSILDEKPGALSPGLQSAMDVLIAADGFTFTNSGRSAAARWPLTTSTTSRSATSGSHKRMSRSTATLRAVARVLLGSGHRRCSTRTSLRTLSGPATSSALAWSCTAS